MPMPNTLTTEQFGSIEVIRNDIQTFTPSDLVDLLRTNPGELPGAVGEGKPKPVPGHPNLTIRSNLGSTLEPAAREDIVRYAHIHNGEMDRLEHFGMRMLARTILAAKRIPHDQELPAIFTITPFHETRDLPPAEAEKALYGVLEALVAYFQNKAPDEPRAQDLANGWAPDGTWLDYDAYLGIVTPCKRDELEWLYEDVRRLTVGQHARRRRIMLETINEMLAETPDREQDCQACWDRLHLVIQITDPDD